MSGRKILAGVVVAAEIAVTIYSALLAWVTCVWMVEDSHAFHLGSAGWIALGFKRLAAASVAAGILWVALRFVNAKLVITAFPEREVAARRIAPTLAGAVLLTALVGAAFLVITRPIM